MSVVQRLRHAWSVFNSGTVPVNYNHGTSFGVRPDRTRPRAGNERSIISSIYTRIAMDGAAVELRHARLDDLGRYSDIVQSGIQYCLNVEANIDQAASMFRQDIIGTLLDKGVAAVVAVETDIAPLDRGGYDIKKLRVGEITEWKPASVCVKLYNESTGKHEVVELPKKFVAIIENPLFLIMNEPNSTLQRLVRKLNLLDSSDEQAASGKLDLIIQLPYTIKSESRRLAATQRQQEIAFQLRSSQHGIAYTDAAEKITQLNRPVENNLLTQIEYLTKQLYAQLGITDTVMNGTADEATMLNYYNRTIEPICRAIAEELNRTFLTKTARTQGQAIRYYRNPFSLITLQVFADVADKTTRAEVFTSNELRQFIGVAPSSEQKADRLRNSNMPVKDTDPATAPTTPPEGQGGEDANTGL